MYSIYLSQNHSLVSVFSVVLFMTRSGPFSFFRLTMFTLLSRIRFFPMSTSGRFAESRTSTIFPLSCSGKMFLPHVSLSVSKIFNLRSIFPEWRRESFPLFIIQRAPSWRHFSIQCVQRECTWELIGISAIRKETFGMRFCDGPSWYRLRNVPSSASVADASVLFLRYCRLLFLHRSPIRLTKVGENDFGRTGGIMFFAIFILAYKVGSSIEVSRCRKM